MQIRKLNVEALSFLIYIYFVLWLLELMEYVKENDDNFAMSKSFGMFLISTSRIINFTAIFKQ